MVHSFASMRPLYMFLGGFPNQAMATANQKNWFILYTKYKYI
jgi:hypothetical protein